MLLIYTIEYYAVKPYIYSTAGLWDIVTHYSTGMSSNILSTLPEIMSQDHDDAARVRDRREEYMITTPRKNISNHS